MKDQIKLVILKTEATETLPAAQYIVEPHTIKRMAEGDSKSLVMEEIFAETLIEDIANLVDDMQVPDSPPYHSTVVLDDGRRLYAPIEKLTELVCNAWQETLQYQDMLRSQFEGGQMMGAVACTTEPPLGQFADPTNSMAGFMGIGEIPVNPAVQEPVNPAPQPVADDDATWTCSCGKTGLTAKFCPECGSPAPAPAPAPAQESASGVWDCPNCSARDLTGKFCPECGTPMPVQP